MRPLPLGRERVSGQQGQGIAPLMAWEMTRWCGEGHRGQEPAASMGPLFAPGWAA